MIPLMYSTFVAYLRLIQVWFFVYLIRVRLNLINKELKGIQVASKTRLKSTDHGKEQQIARTRDDCPITSSSLTKHSTHDRILCLKEIYGELFEACELIRKAFGWSLLAIFTQISIDLTCQCYWVYVCVEDSSLVININHLIPMTVISAHLAFYCSSLFRKVSAQNILIRDATKNN